MPALFVDNLTVIDCSYLHPQRGLLGESWIVDIELHGDLDQQGMVFDFGDVKKAIKTAIDTSVDHKLVVAKQDAGLTLKFSGTQTELDYRYQRNEQTQSLWHSSPADALCILDTDIINTDSVAAYLEKSLMAVVPDNVSHIVIRLHNENITGAFYHYSHGLKKHLGNCQRIAHGHRSAIEIYSQAKRDEELEKLWAGIFSDIYIGTAEDIVDDSSENYHFSYRSQQGLFELKIPQNNCYIMPTDTTVELIAAHLQATIATKTGNSIQVKAFEGVKKGAIA